MPTVQVKVLFFARARELAGTIQDIYQLEADSEDLIATDLLRSKVIEKVPSLSNLVQTVTLAINEEYVEGNVPLKTGDTVAIIPPISGG